jgi:CubicO group peptidase (beta-lactamase class C family)
MTQIVTDRLRKNFMLLMLLPLFGMGQEVDSIKLSRYMDAFTAIHDFTGTVLVIKNDSTVFARSLGFADAGHLIPNSLDTKFRIGSCSKQFTAIAILQLQEQGKLSVKDKLSTYFADFPASDRITIEMLLTHRSGLNDFYQTDKYARLNSPSLTKEKIIELIKSSKLDFQPGTKYGYSNPGYFVLGLIVEKVSGTNFGDYINKNIFAKAKMNSSGVDHNETNIPGKAEGFVRGKKGIRPAPFDNMNAIFACGNLYSTANDLLKYFTALSDTVLLSNTSLKQLTTAAIDNVMPGSLPSSGRYAFGVMVDTLGGHCLTRHGGWCYGFKTDMTMFFREKVLVTVLSNYESNVWSLSRGMQAVLFNVPIEYPHTYNKVMLKSDSLKKFEGQYGRVKIFLKGADLYLLNTASDDDKIRLIPETQTKFSFEGENDRQIEFTVNVDGKIVNSWLLASGVRYILK